MLRSPRAWAEIIEGPRAESLARISTESMAVAGGQACFAGVGSWQNQASGVGLDGPVDSSEIDRLAHFYVSRGVEPKVVVCPFADRQLLEGLVARKFTLREFENVLVRALAGEEPVAPWQQFAPPGLAVEPVHPAEPRFDSFVDVSTSGFRAEHEPVSESLASGARLTASQPGATAVLALLDGEPVGGGTVALRDGVAELFGTSVRTAYRRRGIQTALLLYRLRLAQTAGCTVASIASAPGISTESNAQRVGFQMAYTRVALAMAGRGLAVSS